MAVPDSIPASRRAICAACGESVWRSRTSADVQFCRPCRSGGKATPCGTDAAYRRGCRCQDCRAAVAERMRAYAASRREQGRPLQKSRSRIDAQCQHCGKHFHLRKDQENPRGNYCSTACHNTAQVSTGRSEADRNRQRERGRKGSVRWRALRRASKAARGTTGGNLVWVQGDCLLCGASFVSPGVASRYCSPLCRQKNKSRSFGLSLLDRMAIFDRDGWACTICQEPVNWTADPNSDWYPTLDHIIPRSLGGPDDVSNLRTAHRWCNSVRGDLSHYSDADLAPMR